MMDINNTNGYVKSAKFAVIGLGGMGVEIVKLALDLGYQFLGATDIGEKIGQPVSNFVNHNNIGDVLIFSSIEELIVSNGKPEVVIISASIGIGSVTKVALPLLRNGINILTLEPALFEATGSYAEQIDEAGKLGNASFLATGIQDTWWVHLPALVASANHRITRISVEDLANIDFFGFPQGQYEAGLKYSDDQFREWTEKVADPAVQVGPLRQLALRLGFTPGEFSTQVIPVRAEVTTEWSGAKTTIEPGEIVGASYVAGFSTDEGIEFSSKLTYQVLAPEVASVNKIVIEGDIILVVESPYPPYNAVLYVTLGLVRRIPDILAARPGIIRAADLQPSLYQHPFNNI